MHDKRTTLTAKNDDDDVDVGEVDKGEGILNLEVADSGQVFGSHRHHLLPSPFDLAIRNFLVRP